MPYPPYPNTPAIPYAEVPEFNDFWTLSPGQFFTPPYYTHLIYQDPIYQGWCKGKLTQHVGFFETFQVFAPPGENPQPPTLPLTFEEFDTFCVSRYSSHPWSIYNRTFEEDDISLDQPAPWLVYSNSYRTYKPTPDTFYYYTLEAGPVYRWTDFNGNKYYDYDYIFHWEHGSIHLQTLWGGRAWFPEPEEVDTAGIAPMVGSLLFLGMIFLGASVAPSRRRKP